jgi:hypothetical protein
MPSRACPRWHFHTYALPATLSAPSRSPLIFESISEPTGSSCHQSPVDIAASGTKLLAHGLGRHFRSKPWHGMTRQWTSHCVGSAEYAWAQLWHCEQSQVVQAVVGMKPGLPWLLSAKLPLSHFISHQKFVFWGLAKSKFVYPTMFLKTWEFSQSVSHWTSADRLVIRQRRQGWGMEGWSPNSHLQIQK